MIAESYASQAPFAQGGLSGPAEAFQTSRSHVRNVYSEQVPDYSRYRRFLIPRKTTPVYSYRLRELWVTDIAVMPDFVRRNPTTPYKNCLVIMDHFSKMVCYRMVCRMVLQDCCHAMASGQVGEQ